MVAEGERGYRRAKRGQIKIGKQIRDSLHRRAKTLALDKDFLYIAMLGDREIIGSTPKNPVIMRTG